MTTEYSSGVYVNGCEECVRFLLNLPLADFSPYFLLGDLSWILLWSCTCTIAASR